MRGASGEPRGALPRRPEHSLRPRSAPGGGAGLLEGPPDAPLTTHRMSHFASFLACAGAPGSGRTSIRSRTSSQCRAELEVSLGTASLGGRLRELSSFVIHPSRLFAESSSEGGRSSSVSSGCGRRGMEPGPDRRPLSAATTTGWRPAGRSRQRHRAAQRRRYMGTVRSAARLSASAANGAGAPTAPRLAAIPSTAASACWLATPLWSRRRRRTRLRAPRRGSGRLRR